MHRHANIRHVCETYGQQVLGIRPDDVTLLGGQAVLRLRHRQLAVLPLLGRGHHACSRPDGRRPRSCSERVGAEPADALLRRPDLLRRAARRRPAGRHVRLGAAGGVGAARHCPGRCCTRFKRPLRRRHHRRHRLDRGPAHLPVQPPRRHPSRHHRQGRARVRRRGASARTASPCRPGSRARCGCAGTRSPSATGSGPPPSRQVFQGEWLVTGDTYVCDADGYYTCLGRNSDMLKSGGIWVSPAEVESRLIEHPAVREAAVVGVADEHGIDKPVAVVIAEGVSAEELVAWCREGLAHFKAPHHVVFVDELPKTATGKLQRFKVRRLLAAAARSAEREQPRAVRHRQRLHRRQRQGVRRRVPGRLHLRRASARATSTPRSASTAAPASRSARSRRSPRTAASPTATSRSSRTTPTFFDVVLAGRDAPLGMPGGARKVGDLGTDTELVAAWTAD